MGKTRFLSALSLLLAVFLLASVGQVWAYTINPNPPVAGEPFTITAANSGYIILVFSGSACFGDAIGGEHFGSVTLTEPAGQYSFAIAGENEGRCIPFAVVPQSIPEYPYGLGLVAIFMILGYAVIKRRTKPK